MWSLIELGLFDNDNFKGIIYFNMFGTVVNINYFFMRQCTI